MVTKKSLQLRLLVAASIVLLFFLSATALVLDRAFRASQETAVQKRLQVYIYALLSASEMKESKLVMPKQLLETRFNLPFSGLYADVVLHHRGKNKLVWKSESSVNKQIPFVDRAKTGEFIPQTLVANDGMGVHALSYGVVLETTKGRGKAYTFHVAEDREISLAEIKTFRQHLWGWLVAPVVVLLAVQWIILRWSLRPLRKVVEELAQMEAGKSGHLAGEYPDELRGLVNNLNRLLERERKQRDHYRHSLSDLAHSLKTPLAVLRNVLDGCHLNAEDEDTIKLELGKMNQLVTYQLQKAATSGKPVLPNRILVEPILNSLLAALLKVYHDKAIVCEKNIAPSCVFFGDEGDLLECMGNVLDNAFKFANTKVRVTVTPVVTESAPVGLFLQVEDDGCGVPIDKAKQVLERGVRMDNQKEGYGIGLAIVKNIIEVYGGSCCIDKSELGGARVTVKLPRS